MIDSIYIVFKDGKEDEILCRVCSDGGPECNVRLPLSSAHSNMFIQDIEDNPGIQRQPMVRTDLECPNCGAHRDTFLRKYGKYRFCGFCGCHLLLCNGQLTILAHANGKIVVK
jgi:hypothetical protein